MPHPTPPLICAPVTARIVTQMDASLSTSRSCFSLKKTEIVLVCTVLAYTLAGFLTAAYYGRLEHFKPFMYATPTGLSTLIFVIGYLVYRVLRIYYIIIFVRPPYLVTYLKDDFLAGPFNKERYIRALPVLLSFVVLFSVFTSLKSMIPVIQPFHWDMFWADIDRALHFGVDPWRLLHPVLGHPDVTKFINIIYNGWLPVKYFILYWMLFSLKDPYTRMQFFFACILTWIVNGTILAVLFSSAGPCFYQQITGADRFGELMSYLSGVDPDNKIWAVRTQAMLWDAYTGGILKFGSGISAMPSLHVASAFLFLLIGLRSGHMILKILSVLFYLSILVGSVHLGWHYAVDGYLSTAVTLVLWHVAGRLVRRLEPERLIPS